MERASMARNQDSPRSGRLLGLGPHGFHRLHYVEWGEPDSAQVLVCAHGLTRNGRDFDALAQALQVDYRVACPDLPGRGHSDWLPEAADYGYPLYLGDMTALLARLGVGQGVDQVDWLGTSLGGLLGMLLAAQPNSPIRKLVLNDVGPFLSQAALERIGAYVGRDPRFADMQGLEQYLRAVHAPFGELSDEQWRQLASHSARQLSTGEYALHYDPAIAVAFREQATEAVDLWQVWEAIRCPVKVLRGASSDLLTAATLEGMRTRGPKAQVLEIAGCGHAPALVAAEQIQAVRECLLGD